MRQVYQECLEGQELPEVQVRCWLQAHQELPELLPLLRLQEYPEYQAYPDYQANHWVQLGLSVPLLPGLQVCQVYQLILADQ